MKEKFEKLENIKLFKVLKYNSVDILKIPLLENTVAIINGLEETTIIKKTDFIVIPSIIHGTIKELNEELLSMLLNIRNFMEKNNIEEIDKPLIIISGDLDHFKDDIFLLDCEIILFGKDIK